MAGRLSGLLFAACCVAKACANPEHRQPKGGERPVLAMEGGGFRALASDAGMVAGLLAAYGQQHDIAQPTLAASGLLGRFGAISSVSGSSWFSAELLFSSSFLSLVEGMAASPATAAAQFEKGWTYPWLLATGVSQPKFDGMRSIVRFLVRRLLGTGDEDTIYLAQYFLATGFTWDSFVDVLLNSTAGLGQAVEMGAPVAAWATDKIWLVDHTVVMPSKSQSGCIAQGKLGLSKVSYTSASSEGVPTFLPAKFSVTLGSGTSSAAPFPYASAVAAAELQGFDYAGRWFIGAKSASSGPLGPDLSRGSISRSAGQLPVARTVAASSAFVGSAILEGALVDELEALLGADTTPWIAAAAGGEAFSTARGLVKALKSTIDTDAVEGLASAAVHGVIDGGFSDGTGIAQAVAAGAQEVVVILNSYSTNDPEYVEVLFADGPPPATPGVPPELFPVFQSPVAADVGAAFRKFHRLQIPRGSEFLKVLAVGRLEAVTADNKYFGIQGGRSVVINVINVCSDLNIGEFENLAHYNGLAQEVVLALTDAANKNFVQTVLLPTVLGSVTEVSNTTGKDTVVI